MPSDTKLADCHNYVVAGITDPSDKDAQNEMLDKRSLEGHNEFTDVGGQDSVPPKPDNQHQLQELQLDDEKDKDAQFGLLSGGETLNETKPLPVMGSEVEVFCELIPHCTLLLLLTKLIQQAYARRTPQGMETMSETFLDQKSSHFACTACLVCLNHI